MAIPHASRGTNARATTIAANAKSALTMHAARLRYQPATSPHATSMAPQVLDIITVASDSEYKIDIESHGGGRGTKEVLHARRVGDCVQ